MECHPLPLHTFFMKWWKTDAKNEAHRLFLQDTSIFICSNLWKNRFGGRYAGKKSNMTRVKFLICRDTFFFMKIAYPYISWPINWNEFVKHVESCSHVMKITHVLWCKPPDQWCKLNSDGSILADGRMGIGSIIRDKNGELQVAYSIPFGVGSNNQAEVGVALFGVVWCLHMGINKVQLEVDSQLFCRWINNQTSPHPPPLTY